MYLVITLQKIKFSTVRQARIFCLLIWPFLLYFKREKMFPCFVQLKKIKENACRRIIKLFVEFCQKVCVVPFVFRRCLAFLSKYVEKVTFSQSLCFCEIIVSLHQQTLHRSLMSLDHAKISKNIPTLWCQIRIIGSSLGPMVGHPHIDCCGPKIANVDDTFLFLDPVISYSDHVFHFNPPMVFIQTVIFQNFTSRVLLW